MRKTKILFALIIISLLSCSRSEKTQGTFTPFPDNLSGMLDSVWLSEQIPIRKRDSLMDIYGVDSKEAEEYQKIYRENHAVNILKIRNLLDNYGWPDTTLIDIRDVEPFVMCFNMMIRRPGSTISRA